MRISASLSDSASFGDGAVFGLLLATLAALMWAVLPVTKQNGGSNFWTRFSDPLTIFTAVWSLQRWLWSMYLGSSSAPWIKLMKRSALVGELSLRHAEQLRAAPSVEKFGICGKEAKTASVLDQIVVTFRRMQASASHFAAFVSGVLLNWGTAITVVAFGLVSLNTAVLPVQWPLESRLKWLSRLAVAYIFVACFLAGVSIYQK